MATPTIEVATVPVEDFNVSDSSDQWAELIATSNNPTTAPSIHIEKNEHSFGRSKANDTHFDNPGISGSHAVIKRESENNTTIIRLLDKR